MKTYQITEKITNSDELSKKIKFDLNNKYFIKNENALKDINQLGEKILNTIFDEVLKLKS